MGNTVKEQKERLQQLALRLGLTIRDIARIADMSEATLYHVTDETRIMSGRTASKICYHMVSFALIYYTFDLIAAASTEFRYLHIDVFYIFYG